MSQMRSAGWRNADAVACVAALRLRFATGRTPLGRGRAWLRLALMQKKLSDYMKTIVNRKDLLRSASRCAFGRLAVRRVSPAETFFLCVRAQ